MEASVTTGTRVRDRAEENRKDVALVLRARDGDQTAFDELHHKYRGNFLRWIRPWIRCNLWEDELADAALAELLKVLNQYKPELSAFSSWAFIVMKTSVIKSIAKLATNRNDVSADEFLEEMLPALTGPDDDFVVARLHEEVANLAPEQRVAVNGEYFEGRTDEDLAAELSIPRRRVSYRRQQGLATMRKRLSDVAFTSIRPETRFSRYYYMMDHDVKANDLALLGGEEGD
jgi:RNA polymerase sigma factor (sigma-70 family)